MNSFGEGIDWLPGKRSAVQVFFREVPFVGYNARLVKHVRATLEKRDHDECLDLWRSAGFADGQFIYLLKVLFDATRPFLKWPNHLFFPSDRFAVIAGQMPGVFFDPEDILSDIVARAHGGKSVDVLLAIYDLIEREGDMKEFFALMSNLKCVTGHTFSKDR